MDHRPHGFDSSGPDSSAWTCGTSSASLDSRRETTWPAAAPDLSVWPHAGDPGKSGIVRRLRKGAFMEAAGVSPQKENRSAGLELLAAE
jgi:hypothetical protein